MNTFEFDKTESIRQSMEWLVQDQLVRHLVQEFVNGIPLPCGATECPGRACERLSECAKGLNLSPEMRAATAIAADLNGGHIKCLRDTQTNDY